MLFAIFWEGGKSGLFLPKKYATAVTPNKTAKQGRIIPTIAPADIPLEFLLIEGKLGLVKLMLEFASLSN